MSSPLQPKLFDFLGNIEISKEKNFSGMLQLGLNAIPGVGNIASGAVAGLDAVFGGKVSENINRFISSGFNFTCLGKQAYTTNDLKRDLAELQSDFNTAKSGTVTDFEKFLNKYSELLGFSYKLRSKFRSKCSKQAMSERINRIEAMFKEILTNVDHTTKDYDWREPNGEFIRVKHYTLNVKPQVSETYNPNNVNTPTKEQFIKEFGSEIEKNASQYGMDSSVALDLAYSQFVQSGGILPSQGGGSIIWNEDGVTYDIGISNRKQNNNLLLFAIIGLVAWKLIK